jgi:hypothetical protein
VKRVGLVAGVALLGAGTVWVTAPALSSSAPPAVPCADVIGHASGPLQSGYRRVLGVISVPPGYTAQGAERVDDAGRWRYWRKAGMVVQGGTFTVTVTVPKAWRTRVAITWGNNDLPPVSALRFTGCGAGARTWNAYAGGFLLRSARACVPLVFRVGSSSATVRFGIGRRCR